MRLEDKTAIVTGVGCGFGEGIVLKLAVEGAKVTVADMSMETTSATAEETNAPSGTTKAFVVNIVKQDEAKAMMGFTVESFGTLDVTVNNTGTNRDATLHKMTAEQWDQVIVVNPTSTFYYVQYAAQVMREKGSGAIVNIFFTSWLGNIGQVNYAASKADVMGLIKTTCRELVGKGVTCDAICPGFIDTDMTRGVPEKVWDTMISKIPMGRAGSPTDVANVVAFLASDKANYITGEVINVDGDMILQ